MTPMMADRIPGLLLVAAFLIFVTGAAMGFMAPSLRDKPPFVTDFTDAAPAIADNPAAWQWANGLILAAAVITVLRLAPISLRFSGASRPWPVAGLPSFAMAAVFSVVSRLITIGGSTWAAQRYTDPTVQAIYEAFSKIHLGTIFLILAFVSVGLYGKNAPLA